MSRYGSCARELTLPKQMFVSFDVFDTLIKRSVAQPSDLFSLVERVVDRENGNSPSEFARKRQHAAKVAAESQAAPVTLEQIYHILRADVGDKALHWMDLEVQMELDGCSPNPPCVDLFQQCVQKGKYVILISDMYLSSEVIRRMLEKCGITGFQKLYVSCEVGGKKRDGSLFRLVLNELNITPSRLFHIGDRKRSDFLVPLSMGIRAKWIPNDSKSLYRTPKELIEKSALEWRTLQTCTKVCSYGMSDYEKQGCAMFGPLLYGFTLWLSDQLQKEDIKEVYFVARDGYMMQKAFDLLHIPGIITHYLYASRRSFIAPMFWKHSEFSETTHYIGHVQNITLRNYLVRLGLEPEDYIHAAKKFGLEIDCSWDIKSFQTSKKIQGFYDSIRDDVREEAKEEYEALFAYIRSLNMGDRIAIVDIGYHGTTADAFQEMVHEENLNIKVYGYYVAVSPKAFRSLENALYMRGYLCAIDHDEDIYEKITSYLPIFEAQFLESHGSVKRFILKDGVAVPEFYEFEYSLPDGGYSYEYSFIKEYQKGAIEFVNFMFSHLSCHPIRLDSNVSLYGLNRLGYKPTLKEAKLWGDFHRLSMVYYNVAKPQRYLSYLLHPMLITEDLMKCLWKIGFIKRLLKLPLPYDKIYFFLKCRYRK